MIYLRQRYNAIAANLWLAYRLAARGKRRTGSTAAFEHQVADRLIALQSGAVQKDVSPLEPGKHAGENDMTQPHDPEGRRLPIKPDATTNGEFAPIPLEPVHRQARRLAQVLILACGAASTLLAMNAAYAVAGRVGSFFEVTKEAAVDQEVAAAVLEGHELIFGVQSHYVNPKGAWLKY